MVYSITRLVCGKRPDNFQVRQLCLSVVFSGVLQCVICCHVDDFLWAGEERFEQRVIDSFRRDFQVGTEKNGPFIIWVLKFVKNKTELSQRSFIEKLEQLRQTDTSAKSARSTLGKLQWLATQSRPDLITEYRF